VDEKEFAPFVASLDYPMYVLTVNGGGRLGKAGCLVGFATQCSISPPKFLVCLSKQNHTYRAAAETRLAALHVLAVTDLDLATLFGTQTGDEVDKFQECAWTEGPGGVPLLDRCPTWLVGEIEQRTDLGDHEGLLLNPVQVAGDVSLAPLAFSAVRDLNAGHDASGHDA